MMKTLTKDGLKVLQFEEPKFENCFHGFFARHGGISPAPWMSLNQGGTVGDERSNVVENRERSFRFFNRDVRSIYDVWQIHGTTTICTNSPRDLDAPHIKADAIFTNNPDVTLFMRFADCVPIMIFDPIKKVTGIIHAGWKGTVNDIVGKSIQSIIRTYGCEPENLIAGIGPSIGPDHYSVGEEVREQVDANFDSYSQNILDRIDGKIHFNLWLANQYLLQKQGVKSIECSRICTACHTEDWYSHRAENGSTGRFGALIALKG
jgi:YfiH family protein